MPAKAKKPQVRVVLSLHMPKPQHAKLVRAAKKSKSSVAGFIRDAAERYADDILGAVNGGSDETAAATAA
ncbi:MAG: hypothetical protein K2Y26_17905 [Gemmatimonadaceae bacterium]|nr:hypothetical protein [Gemmatimonadaceae bacterium]